MFSINAFVKIDVYKISKCLYSDFNLAISIAFTILMGNKSMHYQPALFYANLCCLLRREHAITQHELDALVNLHAHTMRTALARNKQRISGSF